LPEGRLRRDRLPLLLLDWTLLTRAAAREPRLAGRVEGGPEHIVQGPQPDLVAGGNLLPGAHEPRAGAPLLRLDDRTHNSLDDGVEAFHEWVPVVEPLRSTRTTTCGRGASRASRCSRSIASQRTSP
jgi:hypothetical protein